MTTPRYLRKVAFFFNLSLSLPLAPRGDTTNLFFYGNTWEKRNQCARKIETSLFGYERCSGSKEMHGTNATVRRGVNCPFWGTFFFSGSVSLARVSPLFLAVTGFSAV